MLVDLRSDTVTRPTPAMRSAMATADVGDDVFADDPTVNELERRIADLLGTESALFVPSGTMGNQIAVFCHTRAGDEVLLEDGAHIYNYEAGAPAALSGVQVRPISGVRGMISAAQLRPFFGPPNDHLPRPALVCLENTHNRAGGTVLPLDGMLAVADCARENAARVHLDGARLWNACAATGRPAAEYAAVADSVSVCFSKGLGAPVGSALAGTAEFIARARRRRKALGGGMRQVGILAAACLYAIDHHRSRLIDDHARAARLAQSLSQTPGASIDPRSVETNIVIFDVSPSGMTPAEVVARAAESDVLLVGFGRTLVRAVTHLDIDDDGIDYACDVLSRILGTYDRPAA